MGISLTNSLVIGSIRLREDSDGGQRSSRSLGWSVNQPLRRILKFRVDLDPDNQ